ncbi:pyridoxamine 5'-phosphate oxidase family protein [Nocardia fluminea]|uniref:pyridoxamine 5'-phosphate oxidase family protein n=1 Tax=Nocardia fluminea TaxID=134984 RepID=UPI00342DD5A3
MTSPTSSTSDSSPVVEGREHEGEQAVQRRTGGVRPGKGSPMFGPHLRTELAEMISEQPLVILAGVDCEARLWATVLTSEHRLVRLGDSDTVRLDALPVPGDPLRHAFDTEQACATLFLDLAAPRRVRINGRARRHGGHLELRSEQAFRNCAKYIHQRELLEPAPSRPARVLHSTALSPRQQDWIATADTFFFASNAAQHGADVNHRGGPSGFVRVADDHTLSWPDYRGNGFYMTFGNLELDQSCGLCFLDWEHGHSLHLSGIARVEWGPDPHDHTHRIVHFTVEHVVEIRDTTTLRWRSSDPTPITSPDQQEGRP